MNTNRLLAAGAAIALCSCQPHSDPGWPEERAPALTADSAVKEGHQTPPDAPDVVQTDEPTPDVGAAPIGLLRRPDGPILPTMPEELVQVDDLGQRCRDFCGSPDEDAGVSP